MFSLTNGDVAERSLEDESFETLPAQTLVPVYLALVGDANAKLL